MVVGVYIFESGFDFLRGLPILKKSPDFGFDLGLFSARLILIKKWEWSKIKSKHEILISRFFLDRYGVLDRKV